MNCQGKTANDTQCQRSAMANGFCRQHGGSDIRSEEGRKELSGRERRERLGNLDSFNRKLHIDPKLIDEFFPGKVLRWVADRGARLTQMYNRGWDFVPRTDAFCVGDPAVNGGNTDLGDKISVISGEDKHKAEGAYRMVLMMIDKDLHQEDVRRKQAKNDEIDREIKRNLKGQGKNTVEEAYNPSAPIYRP